MIPFGETRASVRPSPTPGPTEPLHRPEMECFVPRPNALPVTRRSAVECASLAAPGVPPSLLRSA